MNTTFQIIGIIISSYLAWAVLYQLTFAIAGHFFKKEKGVASAKKRRFAVLIPAYKEDSVVAGTVRAALRQNYPADLFDVMLIADSLQPSTLFSLRNSGAKVLPVAFEKSTKSKSINMALSKMEGEYEAIAILDADNHAHPDFLEKMNEAMNKGRLAIQGCRAAKNENTGLSVLDGASEAVNNHLLCAGHRALGLSARLAGSGMAFDYTIFNKVMKTVDALGGFDKELELKLTQMGVTIGYAPEAIVYDEKVDNASTFARQRGRWLAAQYRYGRRFAGAAMRALFTEGNYDFFNKTTQMALPPRLVLPGVLAIGAVLGLLFGSAWGWAFAALLAGNLLSFALALPREIWSMGFVRSLATLPLAFASTLKALTLMPLAGKQFLHTAHGAPAITSFENK